jgi:hypothetical protein
MLVSVCSHFKGEASNRSPYWLKPVSIFGLFLITVFIGSSHMLTIPLSLAPFRVMLADTPCPRGFGLPLSRMGYVVP